MKVNIHNLWSEYELIDSGDGKKIERFGKVILIRPESSASHPISLSSEEWETMADWEFIQHNRTSGEWKLLSESAEKSWKMPLSLFEEQINLDIKLMGFKHVGVFPEQILNWQKIVELRDNFSTQPKLLNLFGYTGVMSLVAASKKYSVCHVDALKQLVHWGKSMMTENQLEDIRWITDDAPSFVEKEVRRENFYDVIIMDPPAFGYGKGKKVWKIERDLIPLITQCRSILNPDGYLILSLYTEKVNMHYIVKDIEACGYRLDEQMAIQGLDRFDNVIDHGYMLRFLLS
jgi:23S rRNA (cytosine1962-C5)-methyltransferase